RDLPGARGVGGPGHQARRRERGAQARRRPVRHPRQARAGGARGRPLRALRGGYPLPPVGATGRGQRGGLPPARGDPGQGAAGDAHHVGHRRADRGRQGPPRDPRRDQEGRPGRRGERGQGARRTTDPGAAHMTATESPAVPAVTAATVRVLRVPTGDGVAMSFAPLTHRSMVLVELHTADGLTGRGESWVNYPPWAVKERVATLREGVLPALFAATDRTVGEAHARLTRLLDPLGRQWGAPGPIRQ